MSTDLVSHRLLLAAAGIIGAIGVATAAMASHSDSPNLAIAANFLLFHAPALIAISLLGGRPLATVAGYLLLLGLSLFAGDLAMRATVGQSLFPFAAPLGGGTLILSWLLLAVSALLPARR